MRETLPPGYMAAFKALHGTKEDLPATNALPKKRSSSHGQKNAARRNIEAGSQMKLVAWALNEGLPILSIPNEGNRGMLATHRLKQMGLRPGAADLFLARRSCCGRWPGYWIELKAPGKKLRPNQAEFLREMASEGFRAEWFDDWLLARQSIEMYLGLDKGNG